MPVRLTEFLPFINIYNMCCGSCGDSPAEFVCLNNPYQNKEWCGDWFVCRFCASRNEWNWYLTNNYTVDDEIMAMKCLRQTGQLPKSKRLKG